tara:strand:- start:2516 stop:3172 length:657 start_codon:yes stop_codon:yes gene_type:complete
MAKEDGIEKKELDQDWASLRYYDRNNLDLKSKYKKNRIIFMGDSITEGWEQMKPKFFSKNNFINRGIGGQTTPQMLVRFRSDVIDLKPIAVIILAGTNDIAGNTGPSTIKMIIDNIFSMSDLALKNNVKVVLCSILPVFKYPWNESIIEPFKIIIKINKILEKYVIDNNLFYIDYYSSMVDSRLGLKLEYTTDEVHLNEKGYNVMSQIANDFILQNLD